MMFSIATWPAAPSGKDLRIDAVENYHDSDGEAVAEFGALNRAAFLVSLVLANGILPMEWRGPSLRCSTRKQFGD